LHQLLLLLLPWEFVLLVLLAGQRVPGAMTVVQPAAAAAVAELSPLPLALPQSAALQKLHSSPAKHPQEHKQYQKEHLALQPEDVPLLYCIPGAQKGGDALVLLLPPSDRLMPLHS